jgi:hypothetical protein
MEPFKKFTLLDESITTIATDHTIPNNMENKQSEMKTAKQIAKEIFYLPATNGQAEASIELGAKMIEQYASQFKDRESSQVTGTAEEIKWQLCPKCNGTGQIMNPYMGTTSLLTIPCDVCNGAKILATPSSQSTTIERLCNLLEELAGINSTSPYHQDLRVKAFDLIASIKK